MPSLTPLDAGLRQWLAGGSTEDLQQHFNTPETPATPPQTFRHRDSALRATDESVIYQNSNASLHGGSSHHHRHGTDGQRTTSYDSATACGTEQLAEQWENIDELVAEVGRLHEEVTLLKWQTENYEQVPYDAKYSDTAVLQEEHKKYPGVVGALPHKIWTSPPKPEALSDFPTLKPAPYEDGLAFQVQEKSAPVEQRTTSWAARASAGIKPVQSGEQNVHGPTLSMGSKRMTRIPQPKQSNTTTGAADPGWELGTWTDNLVDKPTWGGPGLTKRRDTVMSTETVIVTEGVPSNPNGKPEKHSPHFAQPTKAATRRIDQTVRKTYATASKRSPEVPVSSLSKGRPAAFETEKRLGRHQRTALPNEWTQSPVDSAPMGTATEPKREMMPRTSKISAVQGRGTIKTPGKVSGTAVSPPEEPDSPARKKTASYMSPTKAAQHRTKATLREQPAQQQMPRVKPVVGRLVTGGSAASSPKSSSASTDKDSFYSAQSRPASRAGASPVRSPTKLTRGSPLKKAAVSGDELLRQAARFPMAVTSRRSTQSSSDTASAAWHTGPSSPMPTAQAMESVMATTTLQPTGSVEEMYQPIVENLRRLDLFKPDQEHRRPSSSADFSAPVSPRKAMAESARRSSLARKGMIQTVIQGTKKRQATLSDAGNRPIAAMALGLRNQTSSAIGQALTGDIAVTPSEKIHHLRSANLAHVPTPFKIEVRKPTPIDITSVAKPVEIETESVAKVKDLAVRHPSLGPPFDPSIIYQGSKPVGRSPAQQDPAVIANGPIVMEASQRPERPSLTSQASSLRAAAWEFTPGSAGHCSDAGSLSPQRSFDTRIDTGNEPFVDENVRPDAQLQPALFAGHGSGGSTGERTDTSPAQKDATSWHGTQCSPQNLVMEPNQGILEEQLWNTPGLSPQSWQTSSPDSAVVRSPGFSPMKSGYTISATRGRHSWKGGDGLEISFRGYGPGAERDPFAPVHMTSPAGFHHAATLAGGYGITGAGLHNSFSPWDNIGVFAQQRGYPKIPCAPKFFNRQVEVGPGSWRSFCNSCLDDGVAGENLR